ncbi:MAG: DUF362 domain-containing protein [Acidobacteriota bacterium]
MKRRDFLKASACVGLSTLLTPPSPIGECAYGAENVESYPLAIAKGKNILKALEAAIAALGGMKKFISKNDIVMVKPNIGWDRTPEQAANTNPKIVAAIVKMCLEAGAKKVKVSDNTCNEVRRCFKRSGIADAAASAGAEVYFLDDRNLVEQKIGSEILKNWPVYRDFLEADKIINVPIAKHHGLTKLTLGMKNLMGAVGGRRNSMHQEIGIAISELAGFFKPALTIIDATRILTGNGPQGGSLSDVVKTDTIIAGKEIASVDALAADHFARNAGKGFRNMKPSDYSFLKIACERGLGAIDTSVLKVKEIEV